MTTDTPEAAKPKLTRDSYDENWNMKSDTPRTDACPHCGAGQLLPKYRYYCGTCPLLDRKASMMTRTELCREREKSQKLEAEVERLKEQYEASAESVARMHEAAVGEIRGPFTSVIDDIKAVRERAEKAEAKANKLESSLRRIIDAPVFDPAKLIDFSMKLLWNSIDEAKATLNPTDNK